MLETTVKSRLSVLICLIIAGEAIFSLPFHVARYFRPTFLEVFGLSNGMLGDVFAVYGITAMLAYFPGGIIADRFSARKLIAISLITTALGGLYLAVIPPPLGLAILFGYWGMTTILLFWAALIRATRECASNTQQGRAFGILDGGRGLVAAAVASAAVVVFATAIETDSDSLASSQQVLAMQQVIYFYCMVTFAAGVLSWFVIPDSTIDSASGRTVRPAVTSVLSEPVIWLQAAIVICAYCGYKGLDNYGLYAFDVLGMDQLASAQFTAISAYLRPVGAIAAGFIADRVSACKSITVLFAMMLTSYLISGFFDTSITTSLLIANLVISYLAVFAIRGIYFALLEETRISSTMTGTAVGLISVVGYTPDIFFASVAGRLLDQSPGIAGHQHYFLLLAAISIVGMIATLLLHRHISKKNLID